LSDLLSSHDGFLFLSQFLHFLLNPGQLTLISFSFFFFYFIPILGFNLVELGFTLVDLRRWWKWVGVEVLVAFIALTGDCCGGGYGGMMQLNLCDVIEGQLCSFSDGVEGLSGWLLEWGLVLVETLE
jgi:hypothetical protein